ncbi:TetR/AcrR family transcriptional regulator [Streptomyces sp. NPDC059063]|uniref:TetR/AcrR family transcriptional regulator n=1 Tax=unclassified Streptomyces TaxID=2593676 RepID=UPI0036A2628F
MSTVGRREQHKERTRKALQEAALRLFEEHGFDGTTVRDIATTVGVTERTFFRYFPSKEDLVLGEILELIPPLCRHIVERPGAEPPFTAVRNALLAVADARVTALGILFSDAPSRFFTNPRPTRSVLFEIENGVADAVRLRLAPEIADGDEAAADLRSSVYARAAIAALRGALLAHSALPDAQRTPAAMVSLIHEAFAVLESGTPFTG